MQRTALIDADIIAYHAAYQAETPLHWGDGLWTLHAWEEDVEARIEDELELAMERTCADHAILALSDSSDKNWRKDVFPSYKENRSGQRKPMLLKHAREYMREHHGALLWPRLEADDVIGIIATTPTEDTGLEYVIVSIDKDLSQIPGLHLRHDPEDGEDFLERISYDDGEQWHLVQTLAGDSADGYGGCPGVGTATAKDIVANPRRISPVTRTLKSGKNAGQQRTEWQDDGPADDVWEAVLCRFWKAGLTVEDALVQARVARILKAEDYDRETGEVRLWQPPQTVK